MSKILVICYGNINRSPLCAALLRQYPNLEIRSAGLRKNPVGRAALQARKFAERLGLSLDDHKPRFLLWEDLLWADVVIVMDNANLKRLQLLFPAFLLDKPKKLYCLNVPDPGRLLKGDPRFEERMILLVKNTKKLGKELAE